MLLYKVFVFSYISMPVPYDGLFKRQKIRIFGQYEILSENAVVIESIYIF
jgi:hypothetical protein